MSTAMNIEITKHCENCGKELFGRTDKRFCNDNCRNEFNRKKKQHEAQKAHDSLPEILKIIKNNYAILMSYGPDLTKREIQVNKIDLLEKGFNFKFCTSVVIQDRSIYKFTFERGYGDYGHSYVFLKDDLEQIKIE